MDKFFNAFGYAIIGAIITTIVGIVLITLTVLAIYMFSFGYIDLGSGTWLCDYYIPHFLFWIGAILGFITGLYGD